MKKTKICDLLSIEYPVIQAPMNWISWAELAAAVSNAGGLGCLGPNAGTRTVTTDVIETGERLRQQIRKVKTLTDKPFAVNIVVALPDYPKQGKEFSDQCMKVVLEEGVPAVILVGDDPSSYAERLKNADIKILHRGCPVNVEIARKAEQAGVDAFIAVGYEGGGHTGADKIPTFILIPQIVDAVKIPVVAGGGIADGRGLVAALALGAEGIYLGTRFMATVECPAHTKMKQAIVQATDTSTAACQGVFGMLRALKNPMMERLLEMESHGATPLEMARTYAEGFRHGLLEGDTQNGVLVCGAAAGMINEIGSVTEVINSIIAEADALLAKLT